MKKKKIVNRIVEDQVADALVDNPDYTAPELKRITEKILKRRGYNYHFTDRTYSAIKKRLVPKLGPKPIDRPWSVGSCIENDVSLETVVPIQKQLLQYPQRFLTIRHARWYSKLHPVLFPVLEKEYPGESDLNQIRLLQIASLYSRKEQIAEINREIHLDTRDLDNIFIFNHDFSLETKILLWVGIYRQTPEKTSEVIDEKAIPITAEGILSKEMTNNEVRKLNKFTKFMQGDYVKKAIAFAQENPDIQPLVEKWMALSLRRDIRITRKDGEE